LKGMSNNSACYITRRVILLIRERESKMVSVRSYNGRSMRGVEWYRPWRMPLNLFFLQRSVPLPLTLKSFVSQVSAELFNSQVVSRAQRSRSRWTTAKFRCCKLQSYCSKCLLYLDSGNFQFIFSYTIQTSGCEVTA
jgi:hypothetical protein